MKVRIFVRGGQFLFDGNYEVMSRSDDEYVLCENNIAVAIFPKCNVTGILINEKGENE